MAAPEAVAEAAQARRLLASSRDFDPGDRLDVLVHALAQLPDDVTLRISGPGAGRAGVETLARAYGIASRLDFGPLGAEDGVLVHPSVRNAATAPVGTGVVTRDVSALTIAELVESFYTRDDPPSAIRRADALLAGERIALVTNLPTHYRVPLLNRVAERLRAAGAALKVLFTATDSGGRDWMCPEPLAFEHERLVAVRSRLHSGDIALNLERRVRAFRPTMVIAPGFSPLVSGRLAWLCERDRVPLGLWSGEVPFSPLAGRRLRLHQRRWIAKRAAFGIAYGSLAGEYLRSLSPSLPVVLGRNTAPVSPVELRSANGRVEVLAVARALKRKRLDVVIEAFRLLGDTQCRLTLIGDGPMLPALKERAAGLGSVRFLGAVASTAVRDAYAASDVALFPTGYDVFGLVLVEAMGAGLPTVTSARAGAVADLCVSEENCLVLPDDDPAAWADAIQRLASDRDLRAKLADRGRATVERRWTLDHSADAMIAGLRLGVLARATRNGRRAP
jgi:glycosyltransferase involved in cell wall biosynthesis